MPSPHIVTCRETPAVYATDDARWEAVTARSAAADCFFYYAVRTTGVYCRPSCGARLALRQNVVFFTSCAEAEQAGFRACKRCRPDALGVADRQSAAVAEACRSMEIAAESPDLNALAAAAGMSRFHFQRVFKKICGVTPKAYAEACRARRVRSELAENETVTDAIYSAGYNSNGRFYATAGDTLGMTPSRFRKGGEGLSIRFAVSSCSLGHVLVAATEKGVCAILFGDSREALTDDLRRRFPRASFREGDGEFEALVASAVRSVESPREAGKLPLDIQGTAFERRVWQELRAIPAGTTATYGEIAARLGSPTAARAVARACAANPLAVAIPCHRVVRGDGSLAGYRWGVERKSALLKRESE